MPHTTPPLLQDINLTVAAGDLLDPYGTPTGQVLLAVPLALWAGCVLWLRNLCRFESPQRYRIVGSGNSPEMTP